MVENYLKPGLNTHRFGQLQIIDTFVGHGHWGWMLLGAVTFHPTDLFDVMMIKLDSHL